MFVQECKQLVDSNEHRLSDSDFKQLHRLLDRIDDLEQAAYDYCQYSFTDGSKALAARERMRAYFGM